MTIALWIIAAVETFRAVCQYKQLKLIESDTGSRDDAYRAFIDHLKETDEEFARQLCDELVAEKEKVEV
jgi:hypothetical protein